MANKRPFLSDIQAIRERARQHMTDGAVTTGYKADREQVIKLLNAALASEIVCVLRYWQHSHMASGIHSQAVAAEFAEHADEEQQHADRLAERITQLEGKPDFAPDNLNTRAHSEYVEGGDLVEMIEENLVAERIGIESYSEMIRYIGDDDPTTRRLLEDILAQEEEHADDMKTLLEQLGRKGEPAAS